MSKRAYKLPAPTEPAPTGEIVLPIDQPIAVYYRQSTDGQIGNVSTSMQTIDMVAYLKMRGWTEKDIVMLDMDAGVSGTTKIDERQGMSQLFELITEGKIRAVACQDEDRLFRDVTQIQVNIFIEACRANHVLVMTPSMVYDFAHPTAGMFYMRQFRFKCEMAAEYITSYIRGRLHEAKRRLMFQGKWTGGGVPPGYMVDFRQTLPDGSNNPQYRKYAIYEPYAEVVREYFRLLLYYSGNAEATYNHIVKHGPYYPDPAQQKAPAGYRFLAPRRLRTNGGKGFCPGIGALKYIFTNVAYIGHFSVNDSVTHYNNHPPLIELDTFIRVFNYLSPFSFDGTPNPNYAPRVVSARPTLEKDRPVARPLCAGILVSEVNGKLKTAGTAYQSKYKQYKYLMLEPVPTDNPIWSRKADPIDNAVLSLLRLKLINTFQPEEWEDRIAAATQKYREQRALSIKQRDALDTTMENLLLSLASLSLPQIIRQVEVRYAEAEKEHQRLTTIIAQFDSQLANHAALEKIRVEAVASIEQWETLNSDEKRAIIHSFVDSIQLTPLPNHGSHLVICWKDKTQEMLSLTTVGETFTRWLVSDTATLKSLLTQGTSQIELCKAFPTRTWKAIRDKIFFDFGGLEQYSVDPSTPIHARETYGDYCTRTDGNTKPYRASNGNRWRPTEIEKLLELLDENATQVEICRAFPHRPWSCIRQRIRLERGNGIKIAERRKVRRDETYSEYCLRVGIVDGEKNDETTRTSTGSVNYHLMARFDTFGARYRWLI